MLSETPAKPSDCPVFLLKLARRSDSTAVLYTRTDKSVPLQNGFHRRQKFVIRV
jgi:hypothetical protein